MKNKAGENPAMRTAVLGCLFVALSIFFVPPASGRAEPTNLRMQRVVREFVRQHGNQVVGVGSWISNRDYRDVLAGGASDHDLRLVSSARDGARLMEEWREARTRLAAMVRAEFGENADRVLARVNLYPPSQLMRGVEDAADATRRFRRLDLVPNLSIARGVPADAARFTEGLYGAGAVARIQDYERSAGRLFYRDGDRVFMGMTDLTHMSEGIARFDLEGMANTSRQWADHIDDALRQGSPRDVAKYLDRMNRDLAKAKNLGRLDMDMPWRTELNELARELRAHPDRIGNLRGRVAAAATRAKLEASVLSEYARVGATKRKVLGAVLEDIKGPGRMRRLLAAAGDAIDFEMAVDAVTMFVDLRSSMRAASEGDFRKAYTEALANSLGMVSFPAALAVGIGDWVLEAAEDAGIDFAAGTQEAWDLMAGIYTARGRDRVDVGRAYTLDDLVREFDYEARLEALVRERAGLAADRELGPATGRTDARVAEAIFQRCWPVIRDAWRIKREELMSEYARIGDEIGRMPVLMFYAPHPATAVAGRRTSVTVTARIMDETFDRKLERMREILRILSREPSFVRLNWHWSGGRAGERQWTRRFAFEGAGVRPVTLRLEVRAVATGRRVPPALTREIERISGLDVMIVGAAPLAIRPAAAPAVRGNWNLVGGEIFNGDVRVGSSEVFQGWWRNGLFPSVSMDRMRGTQWEEVRAGLGSTRGGDNGPGGIFLEFRMTCFSRVEGVDGVLCGSKAEIRCLFIPETAPPGHQSAIRMMISAARRTPPWSPMASTLAQPPSPTVEIEILENSGRSAFTFGPARAVESFRERGYAGIGRHGHAVETMTYVWPQPFVPTSGADPIIRMRVRKRYEHGGLDTILMYRWQPYDHYPCVRTSVVREHLRRREGGAPRRRRSR